MSFKKLSETPPTAATELLKSTEASGVFVVIFKRCSQESPDEFEIDCDGAIAKGTTLREALICFFEAFKDFEKGAMNRETVINAGVVTLPAEEGSN